jgi:hypothetical protein
MIRSEGVRNLVPGFRNPERTEFPLDKWRHWSVPLLLPQEKSFQFFGDNVVEHAVFRMAGSVFKRGSQHGLPAKQTLFRSEINFRN